MSNALRHFYGNKLQPRDAPEGVDKVWLDWPNTERQERDDMMQALRAGDVVVVYALSHLGSGGEIPAIRAAIEATGASIEVYQDAKPKPKPRGRPRRFDPDPDQDRKIMRLYKSHQTLSYVLERASEIMGYEVKRHHLTRRYGTRWKKPE